MVHQTPAASSRSTPELNSKALPQGEVVVHQVLATITLGLGVHQSSTQKLCQITSIGCHQDHLTDRF